MTFIPARKIKRSAVKNIVRFPAIKSNNPQGILVESILESQYCYHLEFDQNVASYFPQPETFSITTSDGKQRRYTPDFLVEYKSGHFSYIEVKPSIKNKSEHYQDIFATFEAQIKEQNVCFKVVNEDAIQKEPILTNYRILYQYLKYPAKDHRHIQNCARLVFGRTQLKDLISQLHDTASTRDIYSWLAMGVLKFNINNERLESKTEVFFDV